MRQNIKNKKSILLLNLLLLLGLVWMGWSAAKMVRQAWELKQESADTEKQIEDLLRKKEELEGEIAGLESRQGIEREAKRRLNLKLPGEEVVVVVPEEGKTEEGRELSDFWEGVKEFFKGLF